MKQKKKSTYILTRFVLLRFLGFVYLFAFLSLALQLIPLLGEHGLLPAHSFLQAVGTQTNGKIDGFMKLPTVFWVNDSDTFFIVLAWTGVLLSFIVLLGFANVPIMILLWFIYMSFVHIGQLWYSYGWEIQLLETGFLAIFLCPLWDARPFPKYAPHPAVIWLFKWLTFRIYLGSALIKLRGDPCWRDLTCLYYHYETQPIPNPLSSYLHFMPYWFHKFGVLWNHFVELIVPFFIFIPGLVSNIAGILLVTFQLFLILSGNLSFLNWLTIVPALACFDDNFLRKFFPKRIISKIDLSYYQKPSKVQNIVALTLVILIALLSIPVVFNLLSSNQAMNTSFNRFDLVNTYGAFGSIGRERYELILEGTDDATITDKTVWKEYEFTAKPGNVYRSLPIIAPYQPRIDWQIWFAAMERPQDNPWLLHMIWKLLDNDNGTLSLLANNPFPDHPPKYIRVSFYHYQFIKPGERNQSNNVIWKRDYIGAWLPPLSRANPDFKAYIEAYGWKD